MTAEEQCHRHLRQRNRLGLRYRPYWLNPRLDKHLQGQTLNVGCGIGDFLTHRLRTMGVNINPATVEWCHSQGLAAHLMETDVLPLDRSSFDRAVLNNDLEHLTAPTAYYALTEH
jgi:SAM-dependent methyltransferase